MNRPGDDQAGDDRPRDVAARVLRLATEGRGALESDQGEDAGDDGQAHAPHVDAAQLELLRVDHEAVLEEDHEGQGCDARHGGALEDQGQDGRDTDVLVGDQPADRRADGEEDDRMDRAVVPERREQLRAEHGEAAQAGHGDEEVGPDQRPAGEHTRAGPEPLGGVGVHGARKGRSLGELVEAEDHEEQHDGAEGVGQPRPLSRTGERQRDDEHGRHGRGYQRDRLREQGGEAEDVCPQPMHLLHGRDVLRAGTHCHRLSLSWSRTDCLLSTTAGAQAGNDWSSSRRSS